MRTDGLPRLLTIALVAGGLASSALLLSGSPHAQAPGASASAPAGMVPAADVPFYAEWAASPHARRDSEVFNHWNKEGSIPAVCARCHSTPGFLDYLGADASAAGKVDHPAPIGTVITCVACHNDKAVNLTSVIFPSGLKAEHQGNDARCMTCHQGVESTDSVNRVVSGLGDDQVEPKLNFVNVQLQGRWRHAIRRHGEGRLRVSRQDLCGAFAAPATLWQLSWLTPDSRADGEVQRLCSMPQGSDRQGVAAQDPRQQGRP